MHGWDCSGGGLDLGGMKDKPRFTRGAKVDGLVLYRKELDHFASNTSVRSVYIVLGSESTEEET